MRKTTNAKNIFYHFNLASAKAMFFFKLKREEDWKTPVLVNRYLLGATEYWQIGRDVHDFESSF